MKLIKRFMSLALSLCMIMALCFCSFADDAEAKKTEALKKDGATVTLSIKEPVEGHSYKVYQLLVGDVSGVDGGKGTLSNIEAGAHFKADGKTAEEVAKELSQLSGEDLGNAAYGYLDTTAAADQVITFKKDVKVSEKVVPGYYVIVDESYDGTEKENIVYSRYLVDVVGDTEVAPKTSTPTIDKKIVNEEKSETNKGNAALDTYGKTDTAAIGDKIEFEIDGTVPNTEGYKYYYYVINDTLSEGLTFDADSVRVEIYKPIVDEETGAVSYGEKADKTLEKDTDYYLYSNGTQSDGKTFEIAFADVLALHKTYGTGAKIVVTYSATVNEKAKTGETANTNKVTLSYTNKPGDTQDYEEKPDKPGKPGTPDPDKKVPTGETPEYITKTYVTQLNIFKVDQDGMPLAGAEFTLTGDNLNQVIVKTTYTFTEDENGAYWKLKGDTATYTTAKPQPEVKDGDGNVTQKSNEDLYESTTQKYSRTIVVSTDSADKTSATETEDKTSMEVTAAVDANGYLTFTGLNAGEYTLTESKTPTGYSTIAPIKFTITANTENATNAEGGDIEWSVKATVEGEETPVTVTDGIFNVTVENVIGTVLPSTGGIGTTIFYVIGSVMVLGAAVLLITKKRMSSEN